MQAEGGGMTLCNYPLRGVTAIHQHTHTHTYTYTYTYINTLNVLHKHNTYSTDRSSIDTNTGTLQIRTNQLKDT